MRRADGFTLLEIMIAFAIAAMALAALTAAVGGGLRASHAAAATGQALSRAQSRLAAAALGAPGERSGDDGGGFRWRETVREVGRSGGAVALHDVTVEVLWGGEATRRVVLQTFRSRPVAP